MPLTKLSPSEQTAFLRLLLDSTLEGFFSIDADGRVTLCNAACVRLLGYDTSDDMMGRDIRRLMAVDGDWPVLVAAQSGVGQQVIFDHFPRRDGSKLPVEYRAQPITEDGHVKGAICTFLDISERLEADAALTRVQDVADAALSQAYEQLRLAQSAGGVGVFSIASGSDQVQVSETFCAIFGRPVAATLSLEEAKEQVLAEDHDARSTPANRGDGTTPSEVEYRIRRADDGAIRWIYRRAEFLRDAEGRPTHLLGIVQDVTERKQSEAALRETMEQLTLAQQAGGIGVFSIDAEAEVLGVSPEFCRIFDLPVTATVEARVVTARILEEDRYLQSGPADRQAGTTALETEYRIRRGDGSVRWVYRRGAFQSDAATGQLRMIGIVQDITERKAAAIGLKDSQDYLNLVLESAVDYAIVTLDADGCVVLWNAGAQRIYGYAPDEVTGRFADFMQAEADRGPYSLRDSLAEVAVTGRASAERWHRRKSGELFFINGTLAAMTDEAGTLRGFIVVTRDMTEARRAQEALLEARNASEAANIAKTEFLANMSHEIRTPMNAIIGLSALLAGSKPLSERQTEFIRTLRTSAESLMALINDLLDITKIEARAVELEHIPFSLERLLQEVTAMMAVQVRDKRLRFSTDGAAIAGRVHVGDPTRLRQIVVNLASNAVKFTATGSVEVTVAPHNVDGRDGVRIRVADTGIGIAADKLDGIFHKFVQADTSINRKYGGTGLGLAITKTLVDAMGGTITVDSREGQGSVFEVMLPLDCAVEVAEALDGDAMAEPANAAPSVKPQVLLVEDYEPNILVAGAFLDEFGYRWDVARNGLEAIEKVRETAYAAVLMDVQMHGMNGLDATRHIRLWESQTGGRALRIVGMTAHALSGDRERCLGAGMDDYIAKPFHPEDLRRKLQS